MLCMQQHVDYYCVVPVREVWADAGVSSKFGYDVNSLAVPRKAKEAIGGIARLRHRDGRCMTINVEYNQLDPLLKATGDGRGDVNNEEGWSPYPGKRRISPVCSPPLQSAPQPLKLGTGFSPCPAHGGSPERKPLPASGNC